MFDYTRLRPDLADRAGLLIVVAVFFMALVAVPLTLIDFHHPGPHAVTIARGADLAALSAAKVEVARSDRYTQTMIVRVPRPAGTTNQAPSTRSF